MKKALIRILGLSEVRENATACKERSQQTSHALDKELNTALLTIEVTMERVRKLKNGHKVWC